MGQDNKTAALILAAGYSSRAPGLKPLLPWGDSTVIETEVRMFCQAGITDITVVIGHRADELMPLLADLPVRPVFNQRYDQGMFSSVLCGVRDFGPDTHGFFLLPVDMPLVRSHTVKLLSRAHRKTGAAIVYPVFLGRRGHPPLISARLIPAVLAWNRPEGLRQLLEQHEATACEAVVQDEGVLRDIDTLDDYQEMTRRWRQRHFPTPDECDAILAKMGTPADVVRHGRLVSAVAGCLAGCLERAGVALDTGVISTAGLLHDLAKGRPDHARYGARILKGLGYPRVAWVVADHTDVAWTGAVPLTETTVVYLADKLVQKESIVTLAGRLEHVREIFAANPAALAAAAERLTRAQAIAARLEQTVGVSLAQVLTAECRTIPADEER